MMTIAVLLFGGIWWIVSKDDSIQAKVYRVDVATNDSGILRATPAAIGRGRPTLHPTKSQLSATTPSENKDNSLTKAFPELEDAIPGEYLFKFYNKNDRREFEKYAHTHGIRIIDSLAVGNVVRVGINDPRILDELLRNGPISIDSMPNTYVKIPESDATEPLAPPIEGYQPFGDRALEWLGITDNSAWGSGVRVAVLDSGVNASGALSGRSIIQVDLIGEASHEATHGTAVASIIAGGDSTGVSPAVELISIKVMSDSGTGDAFTLAKGIIEAVDLGAQIINMSLGSSSDSFVVSSALEYATERGVLLVAAAGNDAKYGLLYPARYAEVMAVVVVDFNGEHLDFSNWGAEADIAAPGAGVAVKTASGKTTGVSGTSIGTPFVTGAAAEILASDPSLSPEEIWQILTGYSNDAGAPGIDDFFGAGMLDMQRIKSRDKSGIYDMVAMKPFVQNNKSGNITIHISAQNRGTETISKAMLEVDFNGRKEQFNFFNIHPGNTISQPFSFSQLPTSGLKLRFSVSPVGVNDATPNNNAILSIISSK